MTSKNQDKLELLYIEDLGAVTGGKHKKCGAIFTTQADGEEGGGIFTTASVGEEGGAPPL